jgi:hypothetical protein
MNFASDDFRRKKLRETCLVCCLIVHLTIPDVRRNYRFSTLVPRSHSFTQMATVLSLISLIGKDIEKLRVPGSIGHELLSSKNHKHVNSGVPGEEELRGKFSLSRQRISRGLSLPEDISPVLLHPNPRLLVCEVSFKIEDDRVVGLHLRHLKVPSAGIHLNESSLLLFVPR